MHISKRVKKIVSDARYVVFGSVTRPRAAVFGGVSENPSVSLDSLLRFEASVLDDVSPTRGPDRVKKGQMTGFRGIFRAW
jgi:hypothetical protein